MSDSSDAKVTVFNEGPFSLDVRMLVEAGLEIKPNEIWTYGAMSAVIKSDIVGNDSRIQVALRRLSRDHGIEFKNVRTIGYLRLDDDGIVEMAPDDRRSIKRRVSRAIQRSANAKWDNLQSRYKRELDASRSILAVMRQILMPSSITKVRKEVDRAHDQLSVERTLLCFQKKHGQEREE